MCDVAVPDFVAQTSELLLLSRGAIRLHPPDLAALMRVDSWLTLRLFITTALASHHSAIAILFTAQRSFQPRCIDWHDHASVARLPPQKHWVWPVCLFDRLLSLYWTCLTSIRHCSDGMLVLTSCMGYVMHLIGSDMVQWLRRLTSAMTVDAAN